MTDEARQRLAEGRRLLDGGDPDAALPILNELSAHADSQVAGEAWISIGNARYRADDEEGALAAWQRSADLGGPVAWLGWRSAAEQHVRNGDLDEAIAAYREADRRAPPDERGAIANRIAWLLKETGHDFAARRQFNRARGAYATFPAYVTWTIIAINVAVFLADAATTGFATLGLWGDFGELMPLGWVFAPAVANGEWWRLFTSMFLHFGLLHLAFNMYALFLFGPILEQLYGRVEYVVIYLLCGLGGSVLTILAASNSQAAGASGAIFGLFGLAFVVSRRRHLLLGPQARGILSQAGGLLMINLIITFAVPRISWTGHLGGLAIGVLIGLLLVPSGVATLGGLWRGPDGKAMSGGTPGTLRAGAYLMVGALLAAGTLIAVNGVA
jgi:membrane associated rhomboid family serine protease